MEPWEKRKTRRPELGASLESEFAVRGFDHLFYIVLGHAHFQRTIGRFVGCECDLGSEAHQVDFMAALDHAASGGDWSCAGEGRAGCGFCRLSAENKLYGLLDADHAAADCAVVQALGYAGVGAFVLLPDAYVGLAAIGRFRDLLACAAFLKSRSDKKCLAFRGQDHGEEALSTLPVNASEVDE